MMIPIGKLCQVDVETKIKRYAACFGIVEDIDSVTRMAKCLFIV